MSCRPPAPALNEQRRRSRHADHWIGYPPRLRRGGRLGRGRAQTARARRHAPRLLEAFAKKLSKEDVVVIEATGNASSVAAVIAPHVKKVVIANPKQVRIIAHAKIKTDTIDASVLAQLYASGFLPEVWIPDEPTQALRRQVTRRNKIVRQRSRLKNIIQSILHSHLIPSCPHADLCGASFGRSLRLMDHLRQHGPLLPWDASVGFIRGAAESLHQGHRSITCSQLSDVRLSRARQPAVGRSPRLLGSSPPENGRPPFFERRPPFEGILCREADCLQVPLVFDRLVERH